MAKTIIVTGATKGIGRAVVNYLVQVDGGHNLVLVARSKLLLDDVKSKAGGQVDVLAGDFENLSTGPKVVELAISRFGQLDGLVLNHGSLGEVERVADGDPLEWRRTFDVNFFSVLACVKAALPHLRKTSGRIIFTSSGAAQNAYSTWGAYGSSKAALNHLASTLANEEKSITSISLRPGMVDTDMQTELREKHHLTMDEEDRKKFLSAKTDGKLLRADQPGNVIAQLVLSAPNELSGRFLSWNDEALKEYQSQD